MSRPIKEYNDSSVKKLRVVKYGEKEKVEEIISIPHKPLNDEININKKSICDFSLEDQLGEGTFGYVRLGINKQTNEKVAIKILEKKKILEYEDKVRIEREIKILKSLRHPNIVHLYSVVQTKESLYIIMEYAKGIELFEYIGKKKRIEEKIACHIYQQIISGLEYLHKNNIVHRDIKPENLIIDRKTKDLKIVDFGLSNIFNTEKTKLLQSSCGSPSYAAPEMLQGKKYKPQLVDIWSSGIVLYAMICGYLPFEDDNNDLLYRKICIGKYTIPDFVSNDCKDLLRKILVTDPSKRITIKQIKNHPWFQLYNHNGKIIFYEGLFIDKYIIPIDDEIIEKMKNEMNLKEDNIRLYILNNKHNDITTLYYLLLLKKINSNKKSVADLKSNLFKEYIKNSNNILNNNSNLNINKNKLKKNKEIKKNIKTNNNFFKNINEENKKLNSYKKRPVSYGEFNYKNSLKRRKINDINSSKKYQNQISEQKNNGKTLIKNKNLIFENNNDFNEEEELKQKSERTKTSKKEINTIKKLNNKKLKLNTHKDNNEKLEKILSGLKKEIKIMCLSKKEIKEENEKNNIKINNLETTINKKKQKNSYFNHLLSNKKKVFNTVEWDENYKEIFDGVNSKKYISKNNNNNSFKYKNKETYSENNNTNKKELNNLSLNYTKLTNSNINNMSLNNDSLIQYDKSRKKSKNYISIIKERNDSLSNSIFNSKYKHKNSVNRYQNRYINSSSTSKSPAKINKSCVDVVSPDYLLTQNNNTYNYNELKGHTKYENYLTTNNNKYYKLIKNNKKNENAIRQKLNHKKRDYKKLVDKFNDYKNNVETIKKSFQKFNLYLQTSFNGKEEINNNTLLYKNTSENYFSNADNNIKTNDFEPLSLCNIFITNKHSLKNEIDTILEELKLKYKNNGFSYLINLNDKNSIKLKIKSYYNPSINVIQYFKNDIGKSFFYSTINKIQSKIKNI